MDIQESGQNDLQDAENSTEQKIIDRLKDNVPDDKNNFTKSNVQENNNSLAEKANAENISPDYAIRNANELFLIQTLSPEITSNEEKKRDHKDALIKIMRRSLTFQFIALALMVIGFITMVFVFHGLGNDFDLEYMNAIIKFIGLYMTSIVVELIAMLKYIVQNVFDTSITALVSMYKNKSEEKDAEKENTDTKK